MADDDWKDDLKAIREVLNPREHASSYVHPAATLKTLLFWIVVSVGSTIGGFSLRELSGYNGNPNDPILLVLLLLVLGALGGASAVLWTLVRLLFRI